MLLEFLQKLNCSYVTLFLHYLKWVHISWTGQFICDIHLPKWPLLSLSHLLLLRMAYRWRKVASSTSVPRAIWRWRMSALLTLGATSASLAIPSATRWSAWCWQSQVGGSSLCQQLAMRHSSLFCKLAGVDVAKTSNCEKCWLLCSNICIQSIVVHHRLIISVDIWIITQCAKALFTAYMHQF